MVSVHRLKKPISGITGVVICLLFIYILKIPTSMEVAAIEAGSNGHVAMSVLGITLLSISWWIGGLVPDWLTSLVMMILWVIVVNIPFPVAFSGFGVSSVWLIVGAFCLAAAITKTGLFERIAYLLIRIFSPTFSGQVLALLLVGTICSPLIPSVTVKAVLGVAIAYNISNVMGYEAESPGRYGIFMASWFGFSLTASAFKTGSIQGYTLLGALPEEVSSNLSFLNWFVAMIPWLIIFLIASYFAIHFLYKPKKEPTLKGKNIIQYSDKFGKMDREEKIAALILSSTVVLWIFETKLNINASITALIATFFCFFFGILESKEISTIVPWDLVIFLGGLLNLGNIFAMVGLDIWFQNIIGPFFANLNNLYIIILFVVIAVILIRFVIVSQNATIIVLLTILSPILRPFGISPFITGMIIYTVQASWFVPYQSPVYLVVLAGMNNTINFKNTVKACFAYEIINIIGILASIPLWKMLGYM